MKHFQVSTMTASQRITKKDDQKEIPESDTKSNYECIYDAWIIHPRTIEKKIKNSDKRALLGSSPCERTKQDRNPSSSNTNNHYTGNSTANPRLKHQGPTACVNENAEIQTNENASEACNFDKKAWSIAHLPLKTMGMTFFMLYMSGNNAGIFSILVVSYALVNAVKILIQANKNFLEIERAARKPFHIQKTVYCAYSLLGIAFILFKLGTMGLIPVNRGDFFSDIPPHTFPLYAIGT
ncbi:Protein of unknown function (DUF1077) family protein [Cryptosporidium meleagridis]|uniref:ER membrane protein complex subunit 4 n=1 Tax=Cryptosporidium meleagridis TaxID=93969 RepID=A0A2P4YYQ4_9CRYT|nr:Protein of unknown function (DUF1077) family protein [Cryptosporidium meleagridis]